MITAKLKAAFLVPLILFLTGIVLQLVIGNFPLEAFRFPVNIIVIAEILLMVILIYIFLRNNKIIKYLSSGHAAISSIGLFAFLVIIMVLVPQISEMDSMSHFSGLSQITSSWMYAFAVSYMLVSLGLVTMRRLFPLNLRNVFFFINHFGLWIVLAFGNLEQADKVNINISVPEGELIWYGYDKNDQYFEPNFALKLDKFNIEFYPPKLAVVDNNGKMLDAKTFQPCEIVKGKTIDFENNKITILELYENAIATSDTVLEVAGLPDKTYVVQIKCNEDTLYLQNGTSFQAPVTAAISEDYNLAILNPEPKYFGSEIQLFTKSGIENEKHTIEVNNPMHLNNWTVYQTSYFKAEAYKGYVSVFTAVFDPWIKVVYAGLALMFIGAIYLIFSKRTKTETEE